MVHISLTDFFEHILLSKCKIVNYLGLLDEIRNLFLFNIDWEIVQTVDYSSHCVFLERQLAFFECNCEVCLNVASCGQDNHVGVEAVLQ